jgi:hypothetical protein
MGHFYVGDPTEFGGFGESAERRLGGGTGHRRQNWKGHWEVSSGAGGRAMDYRFYFLGHDCRICESREFEATDDTAALAQALRLFTSNPKPHYRGFELWQNRRHIHTENC